MHRTEISRRLVVQNALGRIRSAGVPADRREVEWLLQAAEGSSRAGFMASLDEAASPESLERFEKMIVRRMSHEPVQYILGETEFYGRRFTVTPAVLIPRPETEVLVERVIETIRDVNPDMDPDMVPEMNAPLDRSTGAAEPVREAGTARILDAGTGSGVIAVTVALEVPGAACTALDVSPEALDVARANAADLEADVRFVLQDMLGAAPREWHSAFDILVSNPPYIPDWERPELERQVTDFEPSAALFTGEDALGFYRGLARLGSAVLAPGGHVIVETHADYASDAARIFELAGFVEVRVESDLSGRDRIVHARMDAG